MKCTNIHWRIQSPLYVKFKKHFCPKCKVLLRTVKESRIVYPGTEDAATFDLHITGGPHFAGKVKVVWTEFECPQCNQRITIERMKELERGNW